jgi:hypothetical protein
MDASTQRSLRTQANFMGRLLGLLTTLLVAYWAYVAAANGEGWRERDWTASTMPSSTHFNRVFTILFLGVLIFMLGSMHKTFSVVTAVSAVAAALVFGKIAELPGMSGSLVSLTPALQVLFPVLAVGTGLLALSGLGLASYCSFHKRSGRYVWLASGLMRVAAPIAVVASLVAVAQAVVSTQNAERHAAQKSAVANAAPDAAVPPPPPPAVALHPHHWQIGLLLAILLPLPQLPFRVLTGVGAGVMVQGVAAYGAAPLIVPA